MLYITVQKTVSSMFVKMVSDAILDIPVGYEPHIRRKLSQLTVPDVQCMIRYAYRMRDIKCSKAFMVEMIEESFDRSIP